MANGRKRGTMLNAEWRKLTKEQLEALPSVTDTTDDTQIYYYTGIPCKNGHVAPRVISSRSCCVCNAEPGRKKIYNDTYLGKHNEREKNKRVISVFGIPTTVYS